MELPPLCRVLDVGRPEQVAALSRDAVEQDLAFLGLIVFRNELKPDSRDAILALKKGYVRPVMVTGDNAQASIRPFLCVICCPDAGTVAALQCAIQAEHCCQSCILRFKAPPWACAQC